MAANGGMYRRYRPMNYNKLFDISMPISYRMPVYKGKEEKRPKLEVVSDFNTGSVYESVITMNLHTGTHLDRTLHMMSGGNTIETLELKEMITDCKVVDLTTVKDKITANDLQGKSITPGDFILLKTRNSFEDLLEKEFIYLDSSGAQFLAEIGIKGVGIDSLGIERSQPEHETHLQLMNKKIHILEGLRLAEVEEGNYFLLAAPIYISGAEAAPVRAILLQ
jgi:arylformamidase